MLNKLCGYEANINLVNVIFDMDTIVIGSNPSGEASFL